MRSQENSAQTTIPYLVYPKLHQDMSRPTQSITIYSQSSHMVEYGSFVDNRKCIFYHQGEFSKILFHH